MICPTKEFSPTLFKRGAVRQNLIVWLSHEPPPAWLASSPCLRHKLVARLHLALTRPLHRESLEEPTLSPGLRYSPQRRLQNLSVRQLRDHIQWQTGAEGVAPRHHQHINGATAEEALGRL